MNSSSPTESSPTESGGFALTFGISIGVLSAIAIAIFASYFCTRKSSAAGRSHLDGSLSMDDQDSVVIDIGLDEATLNTYPQLLYSEAKEKLESGDDGSAGASCCSICLAEYKDSDLLRLLPDCDHLFHSQCIDPWLKLHTSCPVCRNSPVRTPSNVTETASREPRRVFFDTWFVQFMH
ncbi:ZINC FINGER C3HC4 TYPE (RING FINGER) PROTEIN [Salix purpurea]|uniref:RING-type E3 ubiquitin transferase n=1 Tax=Salix purpurea TaxID=77065 RepID=A0A9Q0Z104_SALPP|nr:ZINC FINGER C3HC4 TYPE (RING FINGER) PROTEIN [Salix purpurea]